MLFAILVFSIVARCVVDIAASSGVASTQTVSTHCVYRVVAKGTLDLLLSRGKVDVVQLGDLLLAESVRVVLLRSE